MKELPILYSTPMVQGILNGIKKMTRRLKGLEYINQDPGGWELLGEMYVNNKGQFVQDFITRCGQGMGPTICPYGKIGDTLWVRETWGSSYNEKGGEWEYVYKADGGYWMSDDGPMKWKPSIHMPKAACRLFLKIKSIKVERLHDISEDDAKNEGVAFRNFNGRRFYCSYLWNEIFDEYDAKDSFQQLWQKINGKESWDVNPWVWVIGFEKIENPND